MGNTDFEPRVIAATTPDELRQLRRTLRISVGQMACLLGAAGSRTIRRWESGHHFIPQYVDILVSLFKLSPSNRELMWKMAMEEWEDRLRDNKIEADERAESWPVVQQRQPPLVESRLSAR